MTTPFRKVIDEVYGTNPYTSDTHIAVSKEHYEDMQRRIGELERQLQHLKDQVDRMRTALEAVGISNNMENDWR